jgi:hypothetical protein
MHLVVRFVAPCDEATVLRLAAARGVAAYPLSPFYQLAPAQRGLVLGYGALPEPALVEGARLLCEAIAAACRMTSDDPAPGATTLMMPAPREQVREGVYEGRSMAALLPAGTGAGQPRPRLGAGAADRAAPG